jgi:hypothetical protein
MKDKPMRESNAGLNGVAVGMSVVEFQIRKK